LTLCGGCDVTGIWECLEELSAAPNAVVLLERAIEQCSRPSLAKLDRFDLVASTCLLSQIVKGVDDALGENHPRFLDVVSAVRASHLRLLAELAAPGGQILLITDFVSSDTAPEIRAAAEDRLAPLARELLEGRNFFHGVNPAVLASLWSTDPVLAAATCNLKVLDPWRWDFGVRVYLVTAFQVDKTE
jgi:hypothetical protein